MIPIEIGHESARIWAYEIGEENSAQRLLELDLISETDDNANTRLNAYRQHMSQAYNKWVIPRSFQVGDFV